MAMPKLGYPQLELMVQRLDAAHQACNIRISELRRQMDISCDQGDITLREWRSLLNNIVIVQKRLEPAAGQARADSTAG